MAPASHFGVHGNCPLTLSHTLEKSAARLPHSAFDQKDWMNSLEIDCEYHAARNSDHCCESLPSDVLQCVKSANLWANDRYPDLDFYLDKIHYRGRRSAAWRKARFAST